MFPQYQVHHEGPGHADQRGHGGGHSQARAAQRRREYLEREWIFNKISLYNFYSIMSAVHWKLAHFKDIHGGFKDPCKPNNFQPVEGATAFREMTLCL